MTVRELYEYSLSHSLLDHEVNAVIMYFNNSNKAQTPSITSIQYDKIEWSVEDVLALFSS